MGFSNVEQAKHSLEVAKQKLADAKESMKRDVERESNPQRKKSVRESRMKTVEAYKNEVELRKKQLARAKEIEKERKRKK